MANRYWVGGAGTWDASSTTNWSTSSGGAGGASVPTAADDVYFDANSGTGTVTLSNLSVTANSSGRVCRNLDVGSIPADLVFNTNSSFYYDNNSQVGPAIVVAGTSFVLSGRWYTSGYPHPFIIAYGTGTLTISATTIGGNSSYNFGLGIWAGKNVTFSATVSQQINLANAPYVNAGSTVDTNNAPLFCWFNVNGGTVNLRGNLTNWTQYTLTSGTINVLSTSNWQKGLGLYMYGGTLNLSSNSVPIDSGFNILGGTVTYSNVTLTGASTAFGTTYEASSNATFSGTSISVVSVASFKGGGKNYGTVGIGGGTSSQFVSGLVSNLNSSGNPAGTISTLQFGSGANAGMLMALPNNITATTVNVNAQNSPSVVSLLGTKGSGASTITASTFLNVDRVNFCNIAPSISVSGTNVGNGGGNSNITFSTPKTLYISQATNQYLNSNIYATSSGGAPSTSNIPLAHDTIIFDSNSINPGYTFYFYQGVLGNFTCTSAPANTSFYFYGTNQAAFFGNVTITAANVVGFSGNELALWGNGSTACTVDIPSTGLNRLGPTLNFCKGNYTINGSYFAKDYVGLGGGSLTIQSGSKLETPTLSSSTALAYDNWINQQFTLNMQGATIALGKYGTNGNLMSFGGSTFSTFTVGKDASSVIELWDGTSGTTRDVYFPNSATSMPVMRFRGTNASMTYRFSNNNTASFPEVDELTSSRPTSTTFTINGSIDPLPLKVKKWSINGISGTNVLITGKFQYTGTGNAVGQYLTVSNSTVTPANTWYAVNSTNSGGNSGWTFSAPSSGNGLLFGSNF